MSDDPTIFHLMETEFVKNIRQEIPTEDLHLKLRDFMIYIHEVTLPNATNRSFMLDALVVADIEFRTILTIKQKEQASDEILIIIKAAQEFLSHKLEQYKNCDITFSASSMPTAESINKDTKRLVWQRDKSDFNQLCYGLALGKCFGEGITVTDVADVLEEAFNVSQKRNYLYKTISNLKERSRKSVTSFFEWITGKILHEVEGADDPEDYLEASMSNH